MNQASDMFVFQSLAFFLKKVAIFRKNLKVDNFFNIIKNKTRQKKNSNIIEKIWFGILYLVLLPLQLRNQKLLISGNSGLENLGSKPILEGQFCDVVYFWKSPNSRQPKTLLLIYKQYQETENVKIRSYQAYMSFQNSRVRSYLPTQFTVKLKYQ